MQQITRGDYLKDLITIYIDNNLQTSLTDLYDEFVFQCGDIQKFLTPAQVIKISFNEQESQLLKSSNTCYIAGITKDGHKETFNGSLTFNTRGEVVYYEPPVTTVIPAATETNCDCHGLRGFFSNCSQPAIKAYFSLNYVPTKLSELTNDTDYQDGLQVAESISIHNASTEAHPYIQSALSSATEALTVSIQAETTAREEAVSLAISTTEAYADSIVTQATEATKAYADSIVSVATEATEAYTDSVLQSATTAINTTIGDEVLARQGADNNLQTQIDGLAAASDVTDIVGTYAELQAYDTQHLNNNDIIKVLSDETHDDEPSYYRFDKDTGTFSYIGSESAAYTKAQSNSIFVTQTTTVNGKALSSDITLDYADVDALSENYATVISGNTSAIASNTSTLASHTTAIATNTSAISTINGKIPTDASTTNKLVSASTLSASIADFANKDLNNLTSNGEARLHALKAYADEGELLTDPDGLSFVNNYAHSTFDKSKFTVVGSPVITDDGIASGFSSSNYLTVPISTISNKDNVVIKGSFKLNSLPNETQSGIFGSWKAQNYSYVDLRIKNSSNTNYLSIAYSRNAYDQQVKDYIYNNIQVNKKYYYEFSIKNTMLVFKFGEDENNLQTIDTIDNFYITDIIGFNLGAIKNQTYWLTDGSVDLKQFSIIVDGVEIFSGNKTGIDTIKADDYTVVGTPTISADGVAYNFSTSNYLTRTQTFDFSKPFNIEGEFTTGSNLSNGQFIFATTMNTNAFGLQIYSNGKLIVYYGSSNSVTLSTLTANTNYTYKLYYDGTDYKINLNGVITTLVSNPTFTSVSFINLGIARNLQQPFDGSIDLNAFKIYVDGNLVYQPCLKIPYTESKTGSKVVSSPYRDRVVDMSAQFGYANYYTLDEDNGNFTLPQVELYGLIARQSFAPSDKYDNLTLGVSGSTYIAPADGWFAFGKQTSAVDQFVQIINLNNGLCTNSINPLASAQPRVFMPVSKNDIIEVKYTASGSSTGDVFRFIYAQGSESEAK